MATTKATNLGHRSDVTLKGTTTTIETDVVVSDTTTINNAGDDVGLKINSTSTGHIMQLQDSGTDVMVVKDGGNVGIGIADPTSNDGWGKTLEVGGTAGGELSLNHSDASDTQGIGQVAFTRDSATLASVNGVTGSATNKGELDFRTHNGTSNATRMVIDEDGKVGIGEDISPFSKINVVDTSWSSGSPYGAVATITGKDTNDLNWGHLMISDSTTGTANKGGQLRFAVGNNASDMNPIAGISALTEDTTANYGHMTFYTRPSSGACTERMRITSDGHVGIGVTDPGQNTLYVKDTNSHGYIYLDNSSTSNAVWMVFNQGTSTGRGWLLGMEGNQDRLYIYDLNDSSYSMYVVAGQESWTANSDERLKKDIVPMENRLDDLLNIQVRRYKWERNDKDSHGFIAQELVNYAPEAVDVGNDELVTEEDAKNSKTLKEGELKNPWGVSKESLIPMMIKSIQELSAKVTTLENATN